MKTNGLFFSSLLGLGGILIYVIANEPSQQWKQGKILILILFALVANTLFIYKKELDKKSKEKKEK